MALEARIIPVVDEGLGNSAYLVDLGEGSGLVVDPPRDLRAIRAQAERRGLTPRWAADTHLHADFLSGARQLAGIDGATVLASAAGRREFDHRGLHDGDEVDLGGLRLRALATPGHTDEHLSFLLLDGLTTLGVFTGGSLIVGSAARTDLLGAERTEELARSQYASMHRLAELPDATPVWPTHGAGSFCSAPPGAARTTTIGTEKATNPLLRALDADTFVAQLLGTLGSYPAYFDRLGQVNRHGPSLIPGNPHLPRLSVNQVQQLVGAGAVIVDVRPVADAAPAHVPGSLAIPLRPQFATWLGWLVEPETPVVIIRNRDQAVQDIIWAALNVGVEHLAGELDGGMGAWDAAGGPVVSTTLVGPDDVRGAVLDVRQESEFAAGHVPYATHVELADLSHPDAVPAGAIMLMCGHGERALTAATLLERAGHTGLSVLVGGPGDWAAATGRTLTAQP